MSEPNNPFLPVDESSKSEKDNHPPQKGIALCMSGGGYRAMLFHLGALSALRDVGILSQLDRVSCVSGAAIAGGVLGMNWNLLKAKNFSHNGFVELVETPLRGLASRSIDKLSVAAGVFLPGTVAQKIAAAYDKHLFNGRTLQALPSDEEGPRFVINATNVQTGALWRFSRPYMGDYRVGRFLEPQTPLAVAVAASSAFPPFLSPLDLEPEGEFVPAEGSAVARPPYTTDVVLSDGGVYDNLGLETAWKRYQTVLVSDGGGKIADEEEPARDWAQHAARVALITDNQVRALRKKQIIGSILSKERSGAYWGIRDDLRTHAPKATGFPHGQTMRLAEVATGLSRLDDATQDALIEWGYTVSVSSLKRWLDAHVAESVKLDFARAVRFGTAE